MGECARGLCPISPAQAASDVVENRAQLERRARAHLPVPPPAANSSLSLLLVACVVCSSLRGHIVCCIPTQCMFPQEIDRAETEVFDNLLANLDKTMKTHARPPILLTASLQPVPPSGQAGYRYCSGSTVSSHYLANHSPFQPGVCPSAYVYTHAPAGTLRWNRSRRTFSLRCSPVNSPCHPKDCCGPNCHAATRWHIGAARTQGA